MRRRWLSLCTVWPSHSQIPSISTAILALGGKKPEVAGSQIWSLGMLTGLGDVMVCQNILHGSCRTSRRVDANSLICSLGHCECDCHTVHTISQRCLTADWLAPWENDCPWIRNKFSPDWLPSYIKVTRLVLEIFKMAGYFLERPRIVRKASNHLLRAK